MKSASKDYTIDTMVNPATPEPIFTTSRDISFLSNTAHTNTDGVSVINIPVKKENVNNTSINVISESDKENNNHVNDKIDTHVNVDTETNMINNNTNNHSNNNTNSHTNNNTTSNNSNNIDCFTCYVGCIAAIAEYCYETCDSLSGACDCFDCCDGTKPNSN